ncbi:DUF6160 family protein [Pseudomonas citronellolis]|uniref:DUF6160 family protein n=1 Tax=Pseudomonas citronellolis TaxID=53408 RepID=UPI0023E3B003|nr:DUF6160 family protein [Pseudomonas citronellolis]MDF3934058.1 hypothetical protein [Pseudomonas citronellolis]
MTPLLRTIGLALLLGGAALPAAAELRQLADDDLGGISGQDGLSLSLQATLQRDASTRCSGGCGARVAFQPAGSGGNYVVLDNIFGSFDFAEVTLDIVTMTNAAGVSRNVLRIGLQDLNLNGFSMTLAGANAASGSAAGLSQTNLLNATVNGTLHLQGHVNLFNTN